MFGDKALQPHEDRSLFTDGLTSPDGDKMQSKSSDIDWDAIFTSKSANVNNTVVVPNKKRASIEKENVTPKVAVDTTTSSRRKSQPLQTRISEPVKTVTKKADLPARETPRDYRRQSLPLESSMNKTSSFSPKHEDEKQTAQGNFIDVILSNQPLHKYSSVVTMESDTSLFDDEASPSPRKDEDSVDSWKRPDQEKSTHSSNLTRHQSLSGVQMKKQSSGSFLDGLFGSK